MGMSNLDLSYLNLPSIESVLQSALPTQAPVLPPRPSLPPFAAILEIPQPYVFTYPAAAHEVNSLGHPEEDMDKEGVHDTTSSGTKAGFVVMNLTAIPAAAASLGLSRPGGSCDTRCHTLYNPRAFRVDARPLRIAP